MKNYNEMADDVIRRIGEYEVKQKHRRQNIAKIVSAVSVGCLAVLIGVGIWNAGTDEGDIIKNKNDAIQETSSISTNNDNGITIPKREVYLAKNDGVAMDMHALFIYEGRVYISFGEYGNISDEIVGEYLGTSTGMIDEWTPKDGYVDFAGSIEGDFYSVNGYDKEFMLCMKDSDGTVSIFYNDNGITLHQSSDLFEERLHLKGNYVQAYYQNDKEWNYGEGYHNVDSQDMNIIDSFVDALNSGSLISVDGNETNMYSLNQIYHLYLEMNNGIVLHFRLYEGGYVSFEGVPGVRVKIDEIRFNELINILEN